MSARTPRRSGKASGHIDGDGDTVPLFSFPTKLAAAAAGDVLHHRRPSSPAASASPYRRNDSLTLRSTSANRRSPRGVAPAVPPSSPPAPVKSKWYVFAFGALRVPAEMELESIRRRQRSRSFLPEEEASAGAGAGGWRWLRSLSCRRDIDVVEWVAGGIAV